MDLELATWSAWTPGRPDRDSMREWLSDENSSRDDLFGEAEPEVDAVSSRQLRRCSRITKMGLRSAFDCVKASSYDPDEVQLVWVTRHGEIRVTIDLLEDLAADEMLMPMAFSNSVPNTPAAYYDIATNNTLTTRTICGGPESFHQGLIDATGLVRKQSEHPVLFVQADGVLPDPLDRFNDQAAVPFGLSLIVESADSGEGLEFRSEPLEADSGTDDSNVPPGLRMVRWYLGSEAETEIKGKKRHWIWSRRE